MAKTRLRGGVTATSRDDPSHPLNDPEKWDIAEMPDGTMTARPKPGFWTKATPWLVGAGMGYGALASALGPSLGLGSLGGSSAASVAPEFSFTSTAIPAGGTVASSAGPATGAGMGIPWGQIAKYAADYAGGGGDDGDKSGFNIDDIIKLIVAGKGVKDLFGIGGDEEAEWATFEDESRGGRSLDPRDLLAQGLGQNEAALGEAQTRAKTPVRMRSSFAQQPPVFTGGGLPMPIGVTGVDPAMKDPNLLKADMGDASDEDALAAIEMLRS